MLSPQRVSQSGRHISTLQFFFIPSCKTTQALSGCAENGCEQILSGSTTQSQLNYDVAFDLICSFLVRFCRQHYF